MYRFSVAAWFQPVCNAKKTVDININKAQVETDYTFFVKKHYTLKQLTTRIYRLTIVNVPVQTRIEMTIAYRSGVLMAGCPTGANQEKFSGTIIRS